MCGSSDGPEPYDWGSSADFEQPRSNNPAWSGCGCLFLAACLFGAFFSWLPEELYLGGLILIILAAASFLFNIISNKKQ